MKDKLRSFLRYTAAGRILYIPIRFYLGCRYVLPQLTTFIRWAFVSHETDNFTYDLTDLNKRYLATYIGKITHTPYEKVLVYIREIEHDRKLFHHIRRVIDSSASRYHIDSDMHVGRRIGWYVLVRICRPEAVVETGVEKGLGACVITAALIRNAKEGYMGTYYGTETDRTAGNLFLPPYSKFGKILFGDSIKTLRRFDKKIDIFIHDSDHNVSYEASEYRTVQKKLSRNAYVISDNAHSSDCLLKFARKTNRQFLFFQEKPKNHWYPGAGIGIAFRG